MAIPKAVTNVQIEPYQGEHIYFFAVEYVGERLAGSGPGNAHVSPSTVLNRTQPTGVLQHQKEQRVIVGMSEEEYAALYAVDPNTMTALIGEAHANRQIARLAVSRRMADGSADVKEYEKVYVAGTSIGNLVNDDGKRVVEVEFVAAQESEDEMIIICKGMQLKVLTPTQEKPPEEEITPTVLVPEQEKPPEEEITITIT